MSKTRTPKWSISMPDPMVSQRLETRLPEGRSRSALVGRALGIYLQVMDETWERISGIFEPYWSALLSAFPYETAMTAPVGALWAFAEGLPPSEEKAMLVANLRLLSNIEGAAVLDQIQQHWAQQ